MRDDADERRQKRLALAKLFAVEVATWSSEKLRRCYAQPDAVEAAEDREFEAKCRSADLLELGHLHYTAPTMKRQEIAERFIAERLAKTEVQR
jgi:hypothetical protein